MLVIMPDPFDAIHESHQTAADASHLLQWAITLGVLGLVLIVLRNESRL